ncbi:hypothetical protein J6590_097482 [Homalodisca vitripennis]|nr:hypothetical protein J6590_097482 [Homalodisca vitripennis]
MKVVYTWICKLTTTVETKTPANGPLVINVTQPPVIQHKEVSPAGISGTRGLTRVSQWWPDVCTKRKTFSSNALWASIRTAEVTQCTGVVTSAVARQCRETGGVKACDR